MKNVSLLVMSAICLTFCSDLAIGEDILGDYVLVTASPTEGELNPHALGAISARITKKGEAYEITVDDILGIEPTVVPLYIEGKKLSFFLPPRKFTRDGNSHTSNAEAYFGEIVLDLYIAGWATYGETLEAFKLKRVKPILKEKPGQ